jgi:predicted metal-dependent peptidase
VVAHLRPVSGRTARGRTYRREHRNGHSLLPGRGRVGGVQPVFFLDASGSISDQFVQEMLTALRVTPIFAEAMTFVFDTITRGPFLASDAEGIRQAVRQCGGGTRIAGAWTDVVDQVDPACTRVWITDGLDLEEGLPEPWPDDIWVGVGWHPDPVLMSRDELEHRVETWREEYEHV